MTRAAFVRMHVSSGWLLLGVLAGGCQFSENRYLTRTVTPDELVGAWRATTDGIVSLRDVGINHHLDVEDHRIVLRADGSCSIRTFMNLPPIAKPADYRHIESGCRWRVADLAHQALVFELTPGTASDIPHFYFDESDGRLILWQYADDPDRWRYMEFERIGTEDAL